MTTRTIARQQRMRQQVMNEEKLEQQKRQAASKLIINSPSPHSTANCGINGGNFYVPHNGQDISGNSSVGSGYNILVNQQIPGENRIEHQQEQHPLSISAPTSTMHHLLLSSSVPVNVAGQQVQQHHHHNLVAHSPGPGPGGSHHHLTGMASTPMRIRSVSHSAHHQQQDYTYELDNPLSPSRGYSPNDNSNTSDVKSPIDSSFANILGDQPSDDIDWNQIEPSLNTSSTFSGAAADMMAHLSKQASGSGAVKPSTSCPANMASPYPQRGHSTSEILVGLNDDQRAAWMRDRSKKDSHNRIERKRRDYINTQIAELGTLLPEELFRDSDCKKNKGSILKNSVDYILSMRAESSYGENLRQETLYAETAILKLFKRIQDLERFIKQESGSLPNLGPNDCSHAVQEWFTVHQKNGRTFGRSSMLAGGSGTTLLTTSATSGTDSDVGTPAQASGGGSEKGVQRVGSLSSMSPVGGSHHSPVIGPPFLQQGGQSMPTSSGMASRNMHNQGGSLMNELLHADQPSEQELDYLSAIGFGVKTEPPTPIDMDMDTGMGVNDLDRVTDSPQYIHDPVLSGSLLHSLPSHHHHPSHDDYKFDSPME